MEDLVNTTYDVYAEDACGWMIAHEERLPDMAFVEAYVKRFMEYYPYRIFVEKRETYCYYSQDSRFTRKEKTDTTLKFYGVELWATPFDYSECLHLEDPDITEDYALETPISHSNIGSKVEWKWETHNGVLRMFGKVKHPALLDIKLTHKDALAKEASNED